MPGNISFSRKIFPLHISKEANSLRNLQKYYSKVSVPDLFHGFIRYKIFLSLRIYMKIKLQQGFGGLNEHL